ncbi:FUSC family protein [Micromonospora sp. HM5-17]|uniref:FUSC family protein n=1 Tax=Micromonospora sp. HM5-17 TaxID=2487710 RepID=UPI000F48D4CC|nr:FUSC family protein [Micromonospora sp. HM5-17]ROT33795.1 FUSC family protein [Micromonospora sp. HM5-17]
MTRTGVGRWLHRRDPGYTVLRRGLRLSVIAAAGLFGGTYGLDDPVLGLYTLFGAIATGYVSTLPGGPTERARALLAALPLALFLVTLGSLLAVNTWAAAVGILVVGFTVAFARVGGPRILGLATGLQLFFIAASFPPYQPASLPSRLGGVTLGIGLLAVTNRLLWPEPAPPRYRDRLGEGAIALARHLHLLADLPSGRRVDRAALDRRRADAHAAVEATSMARLAPTERPVSAGRRDRALRHAALLLRQLSDEVSQVTDLVADRPDDELARLLRRTAAVLGAAGRTLIGAPAPIGADELAGFEAQIRRVFGEPPPGPDDAAGDAAYLRVVAIALRLAENAHAFGIAARIAAGRAGAPPAGERGCDQFGYAHQSWPALYWQQFRPHLTTRSVFFQGAVRVALALTAARIVAGFLHLNHGFWVLLAILTLMRTSAADTSRALRPVLLGTVLGAAAGTLLLITGVRPIELAILPIVMVLTFSVGPLLHQTWGQALFTVLFVLVFAQVGPADPQLAGTRLLDVALGAAIGVAAGALLWPRGGGGELRRSVVQYLEASAVVAEEVVRALAGRPAGADARGTAWHRMVLADASFLVYRAERHNRGLPSVDWSAALSTAHFLHAGALARLRRGPAARLTGTAGAAGELTEYARRVRRDYVDLAQQLSTDRLYRRVPGAPPPDDVARWVQAVACAGEPRSAALNLVDVAAWLTYAAGSLDRIQLLDDDPGTRGR